jgi:methionyl-tRNA formyltransferase
MSAANLRIIFMGTPEFAVASLDALVNAGCNVIAVVTAPGKPAGRGMKINESAVKDYAVKKGIKVLQPARLKDENFVAELRSLQADLQVVVAFRMLPEIVWNMPPMGTINLHASLLPQYRGAAPINWAIINGEKETGVTTFKLKHEIDTGNILLQEKMTIGDEETAGELHDRMKLTGARLLVNTVKGLADGTLKEIHQPGTADMKTGILRHAPKIFTADCTLNWNKTAAENYNLIRGLSPFPGAITTLSGKTLKVFHSKKEITVPSHAAGEITSDGKTFLKYACSNGYLHITDLQLEGKKRMHVEDFLRGYRF